VFEHQVKVRQCFCPATAHDLVMILQVEDKSEDCLYQLERILHGVHNKDFSKYDSLHLPRQSRLPDARLLMLSQTKASQFRDLEHHQWPSSSGPAKEGALGVSSDEMDIHPTCFGFAGFCTSCLWPSCA
jgi:hypothetical protein